MLLNFILYLEFVIMTFMKIFGIWMISLQNRILLMERIKHGVRKYRVVINF